MTKKIKDIPSNLNSDQNKAFIELLNYIEDRFNDNIYVLKGWAGTGKTYCIGYLIKYILDSNHIKGKIAITGTTNKSVRVIKKSSGIVNKRVTFQTIHKLLGLTEVITLDGKQEFKNERGIIPKIRSTKIVIIDEASMLNDELFHEIVKYREKTKIIFLGDPAQIPPVGRPDCIPFREELFDAYRIKTLELKEIMRQKYGNDIIPVSSIIRQNLYSNIIPIENKSRINKNNEGIEFFNTDLSEQISIYSKLISDHFKSDNFKNNSEYCKIIAWRNKTIDAMNNNVRKYIYGDEANKSKILIGEKLIANKPILKNDTIIFNTNDEFIVSEFNILMDQFPVSLSDHPDDAPHICNLKYYNTTVIYLNEIDEMEEKEISILHEDSELEFHKISNLLKLRAISTKGRNKSWIDYYDFMRKYANVKYAYAMTIHKAQGSTYEYTFILEDDIDLNFDIIERNRIKYTAYTRASKKIYVLKKFK